MEKNSQIYRSYVEILRRELVPAMGCTEPIAIAYCAAQARAALGLLPMETARSVFRTPPSPLSREPPEESMRPAAVRFMPGTVMSPPKVLHRQPSEVTVEAAPW